MNRKNRILISAVAVAVIMTVKVSALTADEFKAIQETAHQMAECARALGFPEDHVIIQTAQEKWWEAENAVWRGPVLTARAGTVMGPSGKETYYNLPMQGVVNRMRRLGYDETTWPYWVRSDGAKMLGDYILCAASFDIRPIGTILETSRGKAIVADTGRFVEINKTQIDLAMQW